jgi:hypothetical protein
MDSESSNNAWVGLWILVFIISSCMVCWGDPDLIDAWIYYLSDGHYK